MRGGHIGVRKRGRHRERKWRVYMCVRVIVSCSAVMSYHDAAMWWYAGMWLNEVPQGEGVFIYKGGDQYRGGVEKGRKQGQGVLQYASGDCYTGPFHCDQREGQAGVLVTLAVSEGKEGVGMIVNI